MTHDQNAMATTGVSTSALFLGKALYELGKMTQCALG